MMALLAPLFGLVAVAAGVHVYWKRRNRAGILHLAHSLCWFVFFSLVPGVYARGLDALVGHHVALPALLLSGATAEALLFVSLSLENVEWARARRVFVPVYGAIVVVVIALWGFVWRQRLPEQAYYPAHYAMYLARPWPLFLFNVCSGLALLLVGGLLVATFISTARRETARATRVSSLLWAVIYACTILYGGVILIETFSELTRGRPAGVFTAELPVSVGSVVLSAFGLLLNNFLLRFGNVPARLIVAPLQRQVIQRTNFLTDRLVVVYGDPDSMATAIDAMGRVRVRGYWRVAGQEVARWRALMASGTVPLPTYPSGMAPEVTAAAPDLSDASRKVEEGRYYANTYLVRALVSPEMRIDGLPAAPRPRSQHREMARILTGRWPAGAVAPAALTLRPVISAWHAAPVIGSIIELVQIARALHAANVWITDELVRLYGSPEVVGVVARRLDAAGVRGCHREIALEATRWIILDRLNDAAILAKEVGVPLSVVGIVEGFRPSLATQMIYLMRTAGTERYWRDAHSIAVLADADRLQAKDAVTPAHHYGWRVEVAEIIRDALLPSVTEEQILVWQQHAAAAI